jgi:hypothetical protein
MALTITDNQNIELDGTKVTLEQLQEAMTNSQVKIKEIAPNKFKTLQKLNG